MIFWRGRNVRRPKENEPELLRRKLVTLLSNFESELKQEDLRRKVLALVPAHHLLRDLGSSLIPRDVASAARDRLEQYFLKYPRTVLTGDELMVIAGIGEWARRVRELRVEAGYAIVTGIMIKEMKSVDDLPESEFGKLKPDDYVLLSSEYDRDAAFRWKLANRIRKKNNLSMRDKILEFLRANVGKQVTGEELRYVAGNKTEWARRVRELRTEQGWPVVTKTTGMPELPVGVYMLVEDKQAEPHDRVIPDNIRRAVLMKSGYKCADCGWHQELWNPSDPRHLELHHMEMHMEGGTNTEENLVAVCNVCHDVRHRT